MRSQGIAFGRWHVKWYGFARIAIEIVPVVLLEHSLADVRVLKIEGKFPLWVQFELPKHLI